MTSLADLLNRYESDRKDDRQAAALGPSATSVACRRQTAFGLQDVTPTDRPPTVTAATVGTMLHEVVAARWLAWADERGYAPGEFTVEERVTVPGMPRDGTTDVVDRRLKLVRDLKTVNRFRFDAWLNAGGPPDSVWQQVGIYALGVGADPSWALVVDALCRETGRTYTYVADFDRDAATAAVERIATLDATLRSVPVMDVPADGKGRDTFPCDRCPWATLCLGPDGPEPVHPDAATVQAAADRYLEAGRHVSEWEAEKARARAEIGDATGTFDTVKITLTTPKPAVDWKALRAGWVEAFGEDAIPTKPGTPALRVSRIAKEQ